MIDMKRVQGKGLKPPAQYMPTHTHIPLLFAVFKSAGGPVMDFSVQYLVWPSVLLHIKKKIPALKVFLNLARRGNTLAYHCPLYKLSAWQTFFDVQEY